MKKYLFYFAISCLTLALGVHLLSIVGIDVNETFPFIWLLHIGIFIVWIPVIMETKKNKELQESKGSKLKQSEFYNVLFNGAPNWMRMIAMGCFFYAILNFFLFTFSQGGTPSIKDGEYILQNHGTLIKTLTKEEYHHFKANEVRGFSGHWILFYGVATVALFRFSGLTKQED
jgi:hypothetical protein